MKTKEEIKNNMALERGYETWDELLKKVVQGYWSSRSINTVIDDVIDIYANQRAMEMVEKFYNENLITSFARQDLNSWLTDNGLQEGEMKANYKINVNGVEREWLSFKISYEQLCELTGIDKKHNPSVTYSAKHSKESGILHHGQSVNIIDGVIFNIHITNNG